MPERCREHDAPSGVEHNASACDAAPALLGQESGAVLAGAMKRQLGFQPPGLGTPARCSHTRCVFRHWACEEREPAGAGGCVAHLKQPAADDAVAGVNSRKAVPDRRLHEKVHRADCSVCATEMARKELLCCLEAYSFRKSCPFSCCCCRNMAVGAQPCPPPRRSTLTIDTLPLLVKSWRAPVVRPPPGGGVRRSTPPFRGLRVEGRRVEGVGGRGRDSPPILSAKKLTGCPATPSAAAAPSWRHPGGAAGDRPVAVNAD